MDGLQPAIGGQIVTGQGQFEFKIDGASWIEGGQLWVLELEPADSFPSINERQEPQSATIAELMYPSAGLAIQEYQHESDKIKSRAPGHPQAEDTLIENGESLKRSARQRARPKKLLRCDKCEKAFRYPSDLARHRGRRHKAAKRNPSQSETDSPTLSESTLSALQKENALTTSSKAFQPNSEATTAQNARPKKQPFCNENGKAFQYPSHVTRHQSALARQKAAKAAQSASEMDHSSPRELIALPVENNSINDSKTPSQNSNVTAKQNKGQKRQYVCNQCGKDFRYPSEFAKHHHPMYKVAKQSRSQLETDSPALSEPTLLALQRGNTFTTSSKAFHQNEATTGRNARRKKQFFCNECGMAFWYPSHVLRHQSVHAGQITAKAAPSASETDNPCPRELTPLATPLENNLTNYSETPSRNSNVTTKWNKGHRRRYVCNQCGEDFRYPSELARHHHRRHGATSGPTAHPRKPFFCNECGKAFACPSHVARHRNVHAGQKAAKAAKQVRKRPYFCNQCGKAFRYPSDIPRHQRAHSRRKTASQPEVDCSSLSESPLLALQRENVLTKSSKAFHQNSEAVTGQSAPPTKRFFCNECGKAFFWPSHVARHQSVHARQKTAKSPQSASEMDHSSPRELTPLATPVENSLINSSEPHGQNSVVTNRSRRHRKRRFCNQCGESCSPELSQDHRVHSRQEAAKRASSEAEGCDPLDLTSLIKLLENTSLSSSRALRQNSKGTTHQSGRHRPRCLSDPCEDPCPDLSDPAWHPCANSEQEAARPDESLSEASSPRSAVQAENAFANSSQTLAKKAKSATEQSTHQRREICGECGMAFRYPSHLARHQAVHAKQKGNLSPWEADSPTSLGPTPVEPRAESTRTNASRALHRNSKVATDQRFRGGKLHFCSSCGKVFQYRSGLARHMRVHSKRKAAAPLPKVLRKENAAAIVSEANSPSSTRASAQKAPATKPYLCEHCGEGFWWFSELTQHEYTHFHEQPYYCGVCGRQFRRRVQLVKHQKWHEDSREGEGKSETFRNVDSDNGGGRYLPREVLQALLPETTGDVCEMFDSPEGCEAGARDAGAKDTAERHPANSIWEIGISGQPYLLPLPRAGEHGCCETDGEGGGGPRPTEPSLQVEDAASAVSEPIAAPSEIFTTTASPGAYGHVASEPKEKTSTANISVDQVAWLPQESSPDPEWFPSSDRERAGLSSQGAKPHCCPVCSKRFERTNYLTRHLNIHRPGKPHRCTLCEQTFGRRSYLLKHLKKIHHAVVPRLPRMHSPRVPKEKPSTKSVTGGRPPRTSSEDPEWLPSQPRPRQPRKRDRTSVQQAEPLSCPVCSKRFECADYLRKHLNVHRPGKPHSCTLCEKTFGRRSYLLKHLKKIHSRKKI